jgi:hypothetical protein
MLFTHAKATAYRIKCWYSIYRQNSFSSSQDARESKELILKEKVQLLKFLGTRSERKAAEAF